MLLQRTGLAVLCVSQAWLAVWALLAPRSFYDDFAGGGRAWVSLLGPYDEHLVRDVGALATGDRVASETLEALVAVLAAVLVVDAVRGLRGSG
jgi:hypothetical protein